MKKSIILVALLLVGCVHTSSIPLGNDMAQIDISAHAIYGRAGAEQMALIKAAQTTIDLGYDKFIVINNGGWNEQTIEAGNYGNVSGSSQDFHGSQGGFLTSIRHPEAKMVIKMFHSKDNGAKKAIDAQQILNMNKERTIFKSPLE